MSDYHHDRAAALDAFLPRNWNDESVDKSLVDDLANVLASMVVGWEPLIGYDLATHPEVVRVMARYREAKT